MTAPYRPTNPFAEKPKYRATNPFAEAPPRSDDFARAVLSDDGLDAGVTLPHQSDPRVFRALQGKPRVSERIPGIVGDMAEDVENFGRGLVPGAVRAATDIVRLPEQIVGAVKRIPENLANPTSASLIPGVGPAMDALRGGVPEAPIAERIVGPLDAALQRVFQPEGGAGAAGQFAGMTAAAVGAGRMMRAKPKVTPEQFDAAVDEARGVVRDAPVEHQLTAPPPTAPAPEAPPIEPVQGPAKPPRPIVGGKGVVPTAPQARVVPDRVSWLDEVPEERGVSAEAVELRQLKKLSDDDLLTEVARVQREQAKGQEWLDQAHTAKKPHQAKFEARNKLKALNMRTQRLEEELQRRGLSLEDMEERLAIEGGEASQYPRAGFADPGVPFSRRIFGDERGALGTGGSGGRARNEAAIQEGLFGEKTLVGDEQTSLLGADEGKRVARLKDSKIQADEAGRLLDERGRPTAPEGDTTGDLFSSRLGNERGRLGTGEGGKRRTINVGGKDLPLNDDGTVTLYHGTTREGAEGIRKTQSLIGKEDGVFLSTDKDAIAGSYGDGTVVGIRVNPRLLEIDDVFPSGRADFRIPVRGRIGTPVRIKVEPDDASGLLGNERGALGTPPTESGKGALPIMGGTAGGIGGAAVGAAQDDEHPIRGAIIGGLAGAAAGIGAGRFMEKAPLSRAGRAVPVLEEVDDAQKALDDLLTPEERAFTSHPVGQKPAPAVSVTADDYANLRSFQLDPTGEARLRSEVEKIGPQVIGAPKRVVTWEETRAVAQELGLDDVKKGDPVRMSGTELLATRNIISTNIDQITALTKQLDDATLPEAVREAAGIRIAAIEKQNEHLLGRFIQARSQKGRDLNSLKILAGRTSDPVIWLAKAKQIAGTRYNDEVRATVLKILSGEQTSLPIRKKGLGRRGAVGVAPTPQQYAALPMDKRRLLVQYLASLQENTLGEKAVTFIKAGLLTNPKTHVVNMLSNTTMVVLETAKDAPAYLFDRLLRIRTGEQTKALLSPGQLARASWEGVKKGLKDARLAFKGQLPDDALAKLDVPRQVNYDNIIADTYVKKIFASLGAEDRIFRGIAFHRSLAEQAKILARGSGQTMEQLIKAPTDEMVLRAVKDAEVATFQDATRAGAMISGFVRPLGPAGELIAPFKRTPGAVATRVIEYSPLGMPIGLWKALRVAWQGKKNAAAQQRAAEILARSTTGSGFVALGYWLAKEGVATGARPDNANDRDAFDLAGKQANAVLIDGEWQNVGRLSPAGNLIALGANLYRTAQDAGKKSVGERALDLASSTVRTVADQPFVTGVRTATSAVLDPQREGGRFLESTAGMVVPAAVGAYARSKDPEVRATEGLGDVIQSRIPGKSKELPGRRTALGDPMERETGIFDNLFNPLTPRRAATDPLIQELTRVNAGIPRLRPNPGETERALATRQERVGRELRKALTQLIASPRYQAASPEEQKNLLESRAARVKADFSRAASTEQRRRERSLAPR